MNVMLGNTSRTHTVTRLLRAKGATRTAHDISQLGVYCEDNDANSNKLVATVNFAVA